MELFFLALLIITMALALGSGYPVAFALPGAAILSISAAAVFGYLFTGYTDSYFHSGGPSQWLSAGVTNLRGVYWDVDRDTLIAIPLFIFMGLMLQRSRIAEDLLVTMAQLFGPIPGGLGISVVFVGALLAATTGIVGATVVAMGLISLPAMLRNNYSKSLATGTIAASGTLGQIIPPSIVLIILADQLASATDQASTARKSLYKESTGELTMPSFFDVSSTSAGEMFLGAFIPGLVLVGLYMVYILFYALLRPNVAPAVPHSGRFDIQFWFRVALILIPPLALILLVLGSIITGIATVNQAGAIGAAGALLMAGYRLMDGKPHCFTPSIMALISLFIAGYALSNYPMNIKVVNTTDDIIGISLGIFSTVLFLIALVWSGWRAYRIDSTLHNVMIETAKTTSLVFIILLGAAMLTAAFRAFGGEDLVKEFLNSLPGGFWFKFIVVMAVIFVLGFFLDFIEIAVVVVPIVAPILLADPSANITAVWLGVMIGLNIQTSFLTPPFGFALFYLRGVAPAIVKTIQMYKGVVAFIVLQIAALIIVGLYPPLVNYLPNRASLLSHTAPPPRNPRLEHCVENYLVAEFTTNRTALDSSISMMRNLDISTLPADWQKKLTDSIAAAQGSMDTLLEADIAAEGVASAALDYRPHHTFVRRLQSKIRIIDKELDELRTLADRFDTDDLSSLDRRRESLLARKESLTSQIPPDWQEVQKAFRTLVNDETKLRREFRRLSATAYDTIVELQTLLSEYESFALLESHISTLYSLILSGHNQDSLNLSDAINRDLSDLSGVSSMKSALSKLRRELKRPTPDREQLLNFYNDISTNYSQQRVWRERSSSFLLPFLSAYESSIRSTIGLRSQPRLERSQALDIASCLSHHRDLSLNF